MTVRPQRPAGYQPVRFGSLIVGGDQPVICIPLVAANPPDLWRDAAMAAEFQPDLLEWRVDYLAATDPGAVLATAQRLRAATRLPILATARAATEGGRWSDTESRRLELIGALAESGSVDAVDVEWAVGAPALAAIKARARNRPVVASWHDFGGMPSVEGIVGVAQAMRAAGADVVKVVGFAHTPGHGLALLNAAEALRATLTSPFFAIAMGPAGAFTRVTAALFGSALTFAAGVGASAPGQMSPQDVRQTWRAIGVVT